MLDRINARIVNTTFTPRRLVDRSPGDNFEMSLKSNDERYHMQHSVACTSAVSAGQILNPTLV